MAILCQDFGLKVGPSKNGLMVTFRGIMNTHQTRGIKPMLFQCSPIIFDAGPTLNVCVWAMSSPVSGGLFF